MRKHYSCSILCAGLLLCATVLSGQDSPAPAACRVQSEPARAANDAAALAMAVQNPFVRLISELRSLGGGAGATGALNLRFPGQQRMVGCRVFSPAFSQPDDAALLYYL
jgi:hypothetical protein